MKSPKYKKRFYRDWVYPGKLYRSHIMVGETDLDILTDKPVNKEFALDRIKKYRRQIGIYITRDEKFLTSLKPMAVESSAPAIVKKMACAARRANVGPMASVAGAIAEQLEKIFCAKGAAA